MCKHHTRYLSIIIAFTLFFTSFTPTYALEKEDFGENPDETIETQDFVPLPDLIYDAGLPLTKKFSMTANRVYHNLDTHLSTGKYIQKDMFPASATYIYISGKLTHSFTGDTIYDFLIRAGLCYYSSSANGYIPAYVIEPTSGVDFTRQLVRISLLNDNTDYYGYIENYYSSGYVTGEVGFYYHAG